MLLERVACFRQCDFGCGADVGVEELGPGTKARAGGHEGVVEVQRSASMSLFVIGIWEGMSNLGVLNCVRGLCECSWGCCGCGGPL
jgi:hypothetical protein